MRLSLGFFLRRVRRLRFPQISQPGPIKHIKIDDEERQSDDIQAPLSGRALSLRVMRLLFLLFLLLLVLAFLVAYIIYKPPRLVISLLQWKYPDVLFQLSIPSTQKVVALTLDDAPSGETAKILDVLKSYGAKATFFVIGGQVADHPGLLQRMHEEGHEVGNHAWADEPSVKLPLNELERQMKEVEAMLPANPGSLKYFRPGSGIFSQKMVEMAKGLGYRVVLGNIFPFDPQIHSAKINSAHVLSMVRPGGVIIMHDRRPYSAEQLERVLEGLAAKKWKVESLGGLLAIAEQASSTKRV